MAEPGKYAFFAQFMVGRGEQAKIFRITFETELGSVAAIAAELAEKGIVAGSKLETVDDGRGGRMIRSRSGFAFGVAGLVTLQDLVTPVWEPET